MNINTLLGLLFFNTCICNAVEKDTPLNISSSNNARYSKIQQSQVILDDINTLDQFQPLQYSYDDIFSDYLSKNAQPKNIVNKDQSAIGKAALKIQSTWKGYKQRKNYNFIRESAKTLNSDHLSEMIHKFSLFLGQMNLNFIKY